MWMALVLVLGTVSVASAIVPTSGSTTAGAASTCADDGQSGCLVTLPCSVQPCGSVDVSPVSNLADGQYVFVTTRHFDPTGSMRVAICSLNSTASDPSCLNGQWLQLSLGPIHIPITNSPSTDNLSTVSYPVFYNPATDGNASFPSHDITNTTGAVPGFHCDNGANPCALVVTQEAFQGNFTGNGPDVSASNSAVVPLTFAAASNGCPASAPLIPSDSSSSLEHFVPAAVKATCSGANGAVATISTVDSNRVATDVVNGGVALGFIDNPSDPAQMKTLEGSRAVAGKYTLIPVAVSGAAVGFLASANGGAVDFPVSSYRVTPNMLAGIVTGQYQAPQGQIQFNTPPTIVASDNLIPPLDCSTLVGCKKGSGVGPLTTHLPFNAFQLLNPSSVGVGGPNQFGSYMSNIANGASLQATSWICSQPKTPFNVDVNVVGAPVNPVSVPVTDSVSAATTLISPPVGSTIWPPVNNPTAVWPFPSTCRGISTIPGVGALTSSDISFGLAQAPSGQAKSIRTWAYSDSSAFVPGPGALPRVAFGVMDTSQASFYGLNAAGVQNASGAFVTPNTASLEAAANDLSPCSVDDLTCLANTYTVNYGNTDPAAYPMPVVTYAVVPNAPQPAASATAVKNLLTNLLNFSHTGSLPFGYAPLPTAMYQAAIAEIDTAVVALPTPPTTTTTTTSGIAGTTSPSTGASSNSSSNGFTGSSSGSTGDSSALPLTGGIGSGTGGTGRSGSARGTTGVSTSSDSGSLPTGLLLVSLDAATRYLLPAIVLLALVCLVAGPLLLFGPGARRRREPGAPE
jgi:hypothetical protein